MVTIQVDYDLVLKEYEKESQDLLNLLRNSNRKYKDSDISDIRWVYSFSYFKKKSEFTKEYYENLVKMPYEKRLAEELSKVRVNLFLGAGYFSVTDRVSGLSDTITKIVEKITVQKMITEQVEFNDQDVIETIPISENENIKPLTLEEQMQNAIDAEDYMEAARIRDEIKKLQEL